MKLIAKNHKPLVYLDENSLLTYHLGDLCRFDIGTGLFVRICSLPLGMLKRSLSHVRWLERILRIEVRAAVKLPDNNVLVSFNGSIYHLDIQKGVLTCEMQFRIGMRDPLELTRIEDIVGFANCTAFGEYIPNMDRKNDIAIYVREDKTGKWEQSYLFKNGEIKHVHNIVADQVNQKVYVLTGDLDKESGIWEAKDNFATLSPVLIGNQNYRAVRMFSIDKNLVYATDSALDSNKVYLAVERNNQFNLKQLCELSGSCIYATETKHYLVFSTTVEPDERLHGIKLLFSCKPGPAIKDSIVRVVAISKKDLSHKTILEYKKDCLPYILFQYGSFRLLGNNKTDELFVYPVGIKQKDGKLYKMDLV